MATSDYMTNMVPLIHFFIPHIFLFMILIRDLPQVLHWCKGSNTKQQGDKLHSFVITCVIDYDELLLLVHLLP